MNEKHFDAILAKNDIAKEIAGGDPSHTVIVAALKDIEKYISEGNQPSIKDVIKEEINPA